MTVIIIIKITIDIKNDVNIYYNFDHSFFIFYFYISRIQKKFGIGFKIF